MAGTVRDLFLAVRVVDRASGPLRKVSSDLRRLQGAGAAGAASRQRALMAEQERILARQSRMRQQLRDLSEPGGVTQTRFAQQRAKITEDTAKASRRLGAAEAAVAGNLRGQQRIRDRISQTQTTAAERAAQFETRAQNQLMTLRRRHAEAVQRVEGLPAAQAGARAQALTRARSIEQQITANEAAQLRARGALQKAFAKEGIDAEAARTLEVNKMPVAIRGQLRSLEALRQKEKVLFRQSVQAEQALQAVYQQAGVTRGARPEDIQRRISEVEAKAARGPIGAAPADVGRRVGALQAQEAQLIQRGQVLARQREAAVRSLNRQQFATTQLTADEQKAALASQQLRARILAQAEAHNAASLALNRQAQIEKAYISQANTARWANRARVVEHLGHSFTIFGLAATAAFGLAGKAAADFQTQATLAATQARPPRAPIARTARISTGLQRVVLQQMRQFPASAEEMQKALYDIFSGTNIQNIGQAAKLLRVFNQEAVAGGADLDTMVQAGITLYNNFPKQFANATVAANKFFAMVRYGRGSASQFAVALNPIIPIAKQAGQSFDDVSTTLAFLSRQSKDVTQNAQGYARVLLLLARPEVRAGFNKIGVSVTDSHGRIRNLLDIITDLQKKVKLTPVQAITFFKDISKSATGMGTAGTIQGQRVWARLVEGAKQYRRVSADVLRDQGEFNKAFGAQIQTPGVRWKIFTNQLHALVLEIGTQAIPAFAKMGQFIERGIKWFDQLSPKTKRAIGYFGAFAAVGTLLGGVLITIVGGLASLAFTLRLLMGARGIAQLESGAAGSARALGMLGSEAGFIGVRLALMMPIVAGLAFLFYRYPGLLGRVAHSAHNAADQIGGLQHALLLLFTAMAVRNLLTRSGAFKLMGMQAATSAGLVTSLRLSLLRLGTVGIVAAGILFIFDAKFRHGAEKFIGDFIHGRMDLQVNIENALRRAGNFLKRSHHLFNIPVMGLPGGQTPPRLTGAQERAWSRSIVDQSNRLNQFGNRFFGAQQSIQQRIAQQRQATAAAAAQRLHVPFNIQFDRRFQRLQQARADVKQTRGAVRDATDSHNMQRYANAAQAAADAVKRLHIAESSFINYVRTHGNPAYRQFKAITEAAEQLGVTKITPDFTVLFNQLIRLRRLANAAQRALQLSPTAANSKKALAAWEAYQKAWTNLQDFSTKEQQKAATKVLGGLDNAQTKAAQKNKDRLEQQRQDFQDTVDSVKSMYDELLSKNQEIFGQLFQGPQSALIEFRKQWGVRPRAQDLLKDIRGQVFQFRRFEGALNRLRRRGAPTELINQLRELGPSALPEIEVLARMQPRQWQMYLNAFKRGQALIKKQTWKDLQDQLSLYRKFGKNVGQAIRDGIASETPQLKAEIRALVLKMFPELKTGRGQQTRKKGDDAKPASTAKHTHYHDHTNINVPKGDSLEGTLAKHRNRMRNRPRYGH